MPFEPSPLSTGQSANAPASRFVPLKEEQPSYNYIEPDGDSERLILPNSSEPVTAPKGTGEFFNAIENDDVFDPPSTVFEETAATFEKQAAYVAYVANAYGLVPDEEIAGFIADRSRALAHAQKTQPEYMNRFQEEFDRPGFFAKAGAIMGNPRAIGRMTLTQTANSAIPLITTYLGAKGGAVTGAAATTAAGNLIPGAQVAPEEIITAPVGAVGGAIIGGGLGAFPGGALVEIGSQIDELMAERGVDTSNVDQVLAALQDDELMEDIKARAERKGITTAAVDSIFQFFGGRFLKAAQNATTLKKVGAGAADVAVQSAGEGAGEAAGQFARDGEIDWGDVMLETVTAISQSVGQTAIGATVDGSKEAGRIISERAQARQKQLLDTMTPEAIDIVAQYDDSRQFAEDAIDGKNDFLTQNAALEDIETAAADAQQLPLLKAELLDTVAELDLRATELEVAGITEPTIEIKELQDARQAIETRITEIENREIPGIVDVSADPNAREANIEALEQFHEQATFGRKTRQKAEKAAEDARTPIDPEKSYSRLEIANMTPETRKRVRDAKLKKAKAGKHKENIKAKYSEDVVQVLDKRRRSALGKKAVDTIDDLGRMTTAAITPISTRLKRISPKIRAQLRRFEFKLMTQVNKDRAIAEPFLQKWQQLPDADQVVLDFAMKNGDKELVNEVAEKHDMVKEVEAIRTMLDDVYARAESVGYDIGYKENFFPRFVKDFDGLLDYFENSEAGSVITEAIHKKELELGELLSQEDKAHLINTLLRGYNTAQISLSQPGALKERNIDRVTADIDEFYETTDQALIRYISTVNEAVEARRFFGKKAKTQLEESDAGKTKDINDSIGFYVLQELEAGNINATQAKELGDILQARFNRGKMSQFWRVYKNLSYIDTMGSPTSALTQIGDLAFAMYKNGIIRTLKVLPDAVRGKSQITREDVGVEKIAAEFEQGSTSAKAVDKVFKAVGLDKMDAIGKETLINGALDRFQKQAKKPSKAFLNELELIFEGETDSVIADLKAGRNTENVKLLVLNELMNFQPIALSEMPEAYLRMGNGRILYMLKSFTIKQLDVYRNEIFDEIRTGIQTGNKAQVVNGMQNMTRLLFFFVAMNASADWLKDLLLGRETPAEDYMVNNILRTIGISKFQVYSARREGIGTATAKTILPPFKFIDSLYKDINKFADGRLDPNDAKSISSIPVAGKLYYWWFGGGTNHGSKSNNNKSKKQEKGTF